MPPTSLRSSTLRCVTPIAIVSRSLFLVSRISAICIHFDALTLGTIAACLPILRLPVPSGRETRSGENLAVAVFPEMELSQVRLSPLVRKYSGPDIF